MGSTPQTSSLPRLCASAPSLYLRTDASTGVIVRATNARPAAPLLDAGLQSGAENRPQRVGRRAKARGRPDTAGAGWAHMPAQELTPELKRELQMIRMRGALDPKRFYRTSDMKKELPKYFQRGTIVEGTGEGKTRPVKGSLFRATLNDEKIRKRAKNQFHKIQQATMEGVKRTTGPKVYRSKKSQRR